MSFFLLLLLMIFPAFSEVENIQIKNLDVNYTFPQGSGVVEKISLGASFPKSFHQKTYPLEIHRRDNSFDVLSPFVDFQWLNPVSYVHNMKRVETEKLNLKVDTGEHSLKGERIQFTPEKTGEFIFRDFSFNCHGPSLSANTMDRLKADCLNKMQASIGSMELPFEFLTDIADQLPDIPTETEDIPAHDFSLNVYKGGFTSYVRIKYVVRAYLKLWGHIQYENEGKTLAIRVDLIKYGVLPVTSLVLYELRRQIKHPNVSINPPWIRITPQ